MTGRHASEQEDPDWLRIGLDLDAVVVARLTAEGRRLDADRYVEDTRFRERLDRYRELTGGGAGPSQPG